MSIKSMCLMFFVAVVALLSVLRVVAEDAATLTAPVGELCMAGDACAAAPVTVVSGPRTGEGIYQTKCIACHGSGAAGAPKVGDNAAWSARLKNAKAQNSAKPAEVLYTHAINGINGMPAKGLCMDCSDDEIKATVDYMLSQSK